MKKLLFTVSLVLFSFSCNKKENKTAETQILQPQNKNEMTALMTEMMDEMHSNKPSGNNDADFAKMMIEHHKGSVKMSELLLEKGKNDELKAFGRKVIAAQNQEIMLMEKFINEKEVSADSETFQKELSQSMSAMMNREIKIYDNIDKDYAEQMIPHHQSAVDMAKVYLKYGKQKELLNLCREIVETQTAEILQLQLWLKNN
ncbi:MAG: DUF305 domain-containing protein [Weeksellaceae bacterium]|nr:DUF305 domain-containing protein [Bacteroidota bacterium]MCG2780362.1 DUF305 domain-containing protein [Weeksellaceae bacterium]